MIGRGRAGISTWLSLLVAAVLALGASYSYFDQFSTFAEYDDEGTLLLFSEAFLRSTAPYDTFESFYGPLYYFSRWLLFGLAGFPISHDVARIATVGLWVLCAVVLGCSVFIAARASVRNRVLLALGATALAFMHLSVLKGAPGHPQEIILLVLCLTYLITAALPDQAGLARSIAIGLAAGALCMVKVNVGVFFSLAAVMALSSMLPKGRPRSLLLGACAITCLALPFVLLRSHLGERWAVCLITTIVGGLCLCLWSLAGTSPRRPWPLFAIVSFLGGFIVIVGAMTTFVLLRGGSIQGMVESLVLSALHLPTVFVARPSLGAAGILVAVLAIAFAAFSRRRSAVQRLQLLAGAKILAAALTIGSASHHPLWLVEFGPSWAWLILCEPPRLPADLGNDETALRRLLAFVAVLQVLQVFPVAGAQLNIGTLTFLPIAALLLSDAAHTFSTIELGRAALKNVAASTFALVSVAGLAAATADSVTTFRTNEPVSFAGFSRTRLPGSQAAIYRWLVESARDSDAYVSKIGLASLGYWSGRPRLGTDLVVGWSWRLFPETFQQRMVTEAGQVRDLLVVDHFGLVDFYPWEVTTFGQFVRREFRAVASVGLYTLLRRTGRPDTPQAGSASFVPPTDEASGAFTSFPDRAILRLRLPRGEAFPAARVLAVDLEGSVVLGDSAVDDAANRAEFKLEPAPGRDILVSLPSAARVRNARFPFVRLISLEGLAYTLALPKTP